MACKRTYKSFSTLLLLLTLSSLAAAREKKEPALGDSLRAPALSSLSVGADVVGFAQKIVGSKFANMEAMAKVGFKNRFFPTAEIGVGTARREGQAGSTLYTTTAPYFRLGMDYNFNYKKSQTNRFFAGLRYGWSAYKFDYEDPAFADPVYGQAAPLRLDDVSARAQWVEFVVGIETKIWSIVHLGWNIRFKSRLSQKANAYGRPWSIPGYGRNASTMWGGTVSLLFDIETKWTRKKKP